MIAPRSAGVSNRSPAGTPYTNTANTNFNRNLADGAGLPPIRLLGRRQLAAGRGARAPPGRRGRPARAPAPRLSLLPRCLSINTVEGRGGDVPHGSDAPARGSCFRVLPKRFIHTAKQLRAEPAAGRQLGTAPSCACPSSSRWALCATPSVSTPHCHLLQQSLLPTN